MYLFGVLFIDNLYVLPPFLFNYIESNNSSVLVFIITLLLLSADFYYLKNIAGRRLVGLRWWNEVNTASGESHWVFESSDPNTRTINATDKRFFWLSLYATPALWIGLAILAIVRLQNVIWLSLVGTYFSHPPVLSANWMFGVADCVAIALVLTITNTLAFSRCDRFSQAGWIANSALSGGIAGNLASGLLGRFFR
jgi:hypothetical protein